MDLGCFHKYIAFYAYINCCKTNSSLKRGNEKVAISNINTIISNDIQKVWNIVLAVDKYNSWRSDLSKTEIINDKQLSLNNINNIKMLESELEEKKEEKEEKENKWYHIFKRKK